MEKILIVQLTRMGDGAQTLPVLKLLKEQKPESMVTLLCVKEFSGIFSRTSFFDRLVTIPAVDIAGMRGEAVFEGLDNYPELLEPYDLVVNFTHNGIGGFFSGVAAAKSKSGQVHSELPWVKSDRAKYVFASQRCRVENLFNIVDMHSAMAGLSPAPVDSYMRIDEKEIRDALSLLISNGFRGKGSLVAFQLGANRLHKAWPPERFAAVAKRLLRQPEIEVVLLGTGDEKSLARSMKSALELPVIDLVGKTGISELMGILKQCSILLSNDTGTIHLAAAAGIRTVGLFFSTVYFGETAPYGAGHAVLQAELPCSPCHGDQICKNPVCRDAITVEAVEAVIENLLGYRTDWGEGSSGLSVYVSGFTSGGALLYAPAEPGKASERFLRGLICRMLWGEALGFAKDERQTALGLLSRCPPDLVMKCIEESSERFGTYLNRYTLATRLLDHAEAVLAGPPTGFGQLNSIYPSLKAVEDAVASSEDSIIKYYHMLKMEELEYSGDSQLIRETNQVYADLISMLEFFHGTIEELRAAAHRSNTSSARRKKTPKVLLVGPIAGGSLPVARSTAAAFETLGYDSFFLDFSIFGDRFRRAGAGDEKQKAAFVQMLKRALVDRINRTKPDLLLGIAQSPLSDARLLAALRSSGVITAYWFVEDFRARAYWKRIARNFDIFFSIQAQNFRNALTEEGLSNHYYLPAAFDINSNSLPYPTGPCMEISFMGAPYPNRVRILERLARFGIKIYGEGWDNYAVPGVVSGERRITESEVRSIYMNTKVNLNLHSSLDPLAIGGGDFVNPRTFELAGMGCFQLIDNRELLQPLYAEDEVIRFGDESELVEKIEYYLKHDSERKEIALKAQRRTLREHLYEHRVVEMMNAFEKLSG